MLKPLCYPRQAQIFISEICAEGCDYCPYTKMSKDERKRLKAKELSIYQWQRVVSFLHWELGINLICLIGGEPAAKRGIADLVSYISKHLPKVTVLFVTSGISLLTNSKLRNQLIEAGLSNFAVSIDGFKETPDLELNIQKELANLTRGSQRKSLLGLYFLLELKRAYPKISFNLSANCILNRETIGQILTTYYFLAKHQIHLNLCPEQSRCFNGSSKTILTEGNTKEVTELMDQLVAIKQQPGNFLVPSIEYLKALPTVGLQQSYQCSQREYPSTLHITSGGQIPYCNWQRGDMKPFNIMWLVGGQKNFGEWVDQWRADQKGRRCQCSWSFTGRVSDYGVESAYPDFWYKFV